MREDYSIDEKSGMVTIRNTFEFVEIDKGERYSPVCPSVVDARLAGVPISFSHPILVGSFIGQFGHWASVRGTDHYTYTVPRALDYVFELCRPHDLSAVPQPLRDKLWRLLEEMLSMGHLAPYYTNIGKDYQPIAWYRPHDTLLALSETLPLLSQEQREQVKSYIQREIEAYTPIRLWSYPLRKGKRRERFEVTDAVLDEVESRWLRYRPYGLPPLTLYALFLWVEQTGNRSYITKH